MAYDVEQNQPEEGTLTVAKKPSVEERKLTKGQLRKLNALRKSLGDEIANEAFTKWLQRESTAEVVDPNVAVIEDAIGRVINKLRFKRGARYAVRRGRGRIIVEAIA